MTAVFADTLFWYGLVNRRDQWHLPVLQARTRLGNRLILTTDEVLTEFLNALSGDSFLRSAGASLVTAIAADPAIIVEPQSHESFMAGLALYERRPDKGYSLTDCISMQTCVAAGITEVLTSDTLLRKAVPS